MSGRIYPSLQFNDTEQDVSSERVVHFNDETAKVTPKPASKIGNKLIGRKKKV